LREQDLNLRVDCDNCGPYLITERAARLIRNDRGLLAGYLKEHPRTYPLAINEFSTRWLVREAQDWAASMSKHVA
jgi:hypothetical protein